MSVLLFSPEQVDQLNKNPYVIQATERRVTYTDAFKKLFVQQYRDGMPPREIFYNAGFDVRALGYKRIERASKRWRTMNNEGRFGLDEDIVTAQDRSMGRKGMLESRLEKLNERINSLTEENAQLREQIAALEHRA